MTALRTSQQAFMHYLLSGEDSSFRAEVLVAQGIAVDTRMQIYANAYRIRLRETIETDHEILGLYLGDDLFEQMAAGYIAKYPSHQPSLRDFTLHLAQFLTEDATFSKHPILSEIARFERLLLDVFDALDVTRATPEDLRSLPPEQWPNMRLRFHPSVQLFQAEWNSVESWNALKNAQTPDAATAQPVSSWLVWRGTDRLSQFRSIGEDETTLLTQALHGEDFSAMCESLLAWCEQDQVASVMLAMLAEWLDMGIIHRINST